MNDGRTIPQLGFGVFQIPPRGHGRGRAPALEVGYRHIDTAEMYGNEKEVGEAVRASGPGPVARSSSPASSTTASTGPTTPARAFDGTLQALDLDYVDLFLIHWPLPTATTATTSRPGGR